MYRWLVFLHILGAFGFMLGHGASAMTLFGIRKERDPEALKALLAVSQSMASFAYICLLIMLILGIILGFMGQWWSRGWIWASLATLIAMTVFMAVFGAAYYHRLRWALGLPYPGKEPPRNPPASAEELEQIAGSGRPGLIAAIGFVGWGLILWLMMFKPF